MAKSGKGAPPKGEDAMQVWRIAPDIMAQPPADWLVKIDPPVRDEVLPAEYVTAREFNALAEPGDLAAVRKALLRLISHSLPRAGIIYQKDQRQAAKEALEAVLEFLDLFRSLHVVPETTMPLRALLRGLESLDLGAVEPMLRPRKKATGRPVSLLSSLVRGYAAAGVELARRSGSGRKLGDACNFVADRLRAAGYSLPATHGHGAITGATVRAWRREAMTRGTEDPMREIFHQLLAGNHNFSSDLRIRKFFYELRAWAPSSESENPLG
jgi:hypothetical protein